MKVDLLDKKLTSEISKILSLIWSPGCVILTFIPFKEECKYVIFSILTVLSIIIIYNKWYKANKSKCAELNINGSKVVVKEGDIFDENYSYPEIVLENGTITIE